MKRARVRVGGREHQVTLDDSGALRCADGTAFDPDAVEWLPPRCGALIGVALNEGPALAALAAAFRAPPHKQPPQSPVLFVKTPNTLIGHRAPVPCPAGEPALQPGGSLVAVIGAPLPMRAGAAQLAGAISAYTILNDFSLPQASYYRPPVRVKCCDGFGPLGPWLVDARQVPDPHALQVRTLVNGELRHSASTGALAHDLPALLASINAYTRLNPGDMLALSVPVQRCDVHPGDLVSIEIDGIGVLSNPVVAAGPAH